MRTHDYLYIISVYIAFVEVQLFVGRFFRFWFCVQDLGIFRFIFIKSPGCDTLLCKIQLRVNYPTFSRCRIRSAFLRSWLSDLKLFVVDGDDGFHGVCIST